MSIAHDIITKQINDAGIPAHRKDKPLTEADTDLEILKSFAFKHGETLQWVVQRYLEINPDALDDDTALTLQREQAKIGLDVMKAVTPKDIDHKVELQVTRIERRIIDP